MIDEQTLAHFGATDAEACCENRKSRTMAPFRAPATLAALNSPTRLGSPDFHFDPERLQALLERFESPPKFEPEAFFNRRKLASNCVMLLQKILDLALAVDYADQVFESMAEDEDVSFEEWHDFGVNVVSALLRQLEAAVAEYQSKCANRF